MQKHHMVKQEAREEWEKTCLVFITTISFTRIFESHKDYINPF